MARRVILIACSEQSRLDARQTAVRRAGYLPLPAGTCERARYLLHKIRPALVLLDLELSDGDALTLLDHLRSIAPLAGLPILVLGAPTEEERRRLAGHANVMVRQVDDDELVTALLEDVLGGPRPRRLRG